jgi:hypothetical protein
MNSLTDPVYPDTEAAIASVALGKTYHAGAQESVIRGTTSVSEDRTRFGPITPG